MHYTGHVLIGMRYSDDAEPENDVMCAATFVEGASMREQRETK